MRMLKHAVLLVPAALVLVACSSTSAVAKADVEQGAIDELTALVGVAPDSLTCPEDLPAEVDATMRCALTSGGESYGVTITVTSVEGDDVNFDVLVDEVPTDPGGSSESSEG